MFPSSYLQHPFLILNLLLGCLHPYFPLKKHFLRKRMWKILIWLTSVLAEMEKVPRNKLNMKRMLTMEDQWQLVGCDVSIISEENDRKIGWQWQGIEEPEMRMKLPRDQVVRAKRRGLWRLWLKILQTTTPLTCLLLLLLNQIFLTSCLGIPSFFFNRSKQSWANLSINSYLQFFFNLSLILIFLYLLVQFIITVQRDVGYRISEYSQGKFA